METFTIGRQNDRMSNSIKLLRRYDPDRRIREYSKPWLRKLGQGKENYND